MAVYYFDDHFKSDSLFNGKNIVMTNGVFDIIHRGHVQYLKDASALNERLVVGLNSDKSVKMLNKGPDRPYICQDDRAFIIDSLQFVSDVIIFNERTPEELVRYLQPQIFVKGSDYKIEDLPEAKIVYSYGGEVKLMKFTNNYSTTLIVNKISNSK